MRTWAQVAWVFALGAVFGSLVVALVDDVLWKRRMTQMEKDILMLAKLVEHD